MDHAEQPQQVYIFDTTLRDGGQSEDVSFTIEDKLRLTTVFNDIGVHYVEGGWPGSNPKDEEYFRLIRGRLSQLKTKVTCFGSTRRIDKTCETDPNIQKLVAAEMPAVCIFGKTWTLHVKEALKINNDQNLEIIESSVSYLKRFHDEVLFDAEHFFDGYKNNPEYALNALRCAEQAGADFIVLCDTNGGTLPWEVESIFKKVRSAVSTKLGIHTHNDSEAGVTNSLYAVREGAKMVQGTFNGFGERCGNCNLISVISNLSLKMGIESIPQENIRRLSETSLKVSEMANMSHRKNQPFVGESAFAHKGGIHVSAIMKNPKTYEHIEPELVGNRRRVLISDLSGISNTVYKVGELGLDIELNADELKLITKKIKAKENQGFTYEAAEASFILLILRSINRLPSYFQLDGYRIIDERRKDDKDASSEATIHIVGPNETKVHTVSFGDGPVDALNNALKKALSGFYPTINDIRLTDYKVRILDSKFGSASKTRVSIDFSDGVDNWTTMGVYSDIIRSSYIALTDSINYKLYLDNKKSECWSVSPP